MPVLLRERGADGSETVLAREQVRVDPQGKPVKVRLVHRPTEPGKKTYILDVPVQPDEKRPADNNRLECDVVVQELKVVKVLYIEGYPRFEYRYVKNLLERESTRDKRNKSIDLSVVLLEADEEYASEDRSARSDLPTRDELARFDVVIVGDADPKMAKLGDKNLRLLADFVRDGGGLLFLSGERYGLDAYRDTPLADVLPVESTRAAGKGADRAELIAAYRPVLTPAGRTHPVFRFVPDETENASIWSSQLPELLWFADGVRVKPGAEVLAVHPRAEASSRAGTERLPLVVQQFVGSGRSCYLGFDETWRWRFREHELRFNQFWIQMVRYLARNRLSQIELQLDRQVPYRRGMPIKVTVTFPDTAPPPTAETTVRVIVERRPAKASVSTAPVETQTLTLAKVEGSRAAYEALVTRTPEGSYRFWLSSPSTLASGIRPQALCEVIPPPGEMDRLQLNQGELEQAAQATHGRYYTLATAERLFDELPTGTRVAVETLQDPTRIWNRGGLFLLALGLLSTEWLFRKRRHLL